MTWVLGLMKRVLMFFKSCLVKPTSNFLVRFDGQDGMRDLWSSFHHEHLPEKVWVRGSIFWMSCLSVSSDFWVMRLTGIGLKWMKCKWWIIGLRVSFNVIKWSWSILCESGDVGKELEVEKRERWIKGRLKFETHVRSWQDFRMWSRNIYVEPWHIRGVKCLICCTL